MSERKAMVDPGLDVGKLFRVLVADDSREIRELLFEALTSRGCAVTCVQDGLEAYFSLRMGAYDLLITDYEMPRLDGLALLRRVRNWNLCPSSILITGHTSLDLIKDVKQMGAIFVLSKPVAIPYLLSLVKTIRAQHSEG